MFKITGSYQGHYLGQMQAVGVAGLAQGIGGSAIGHPNSVIKTQ